MSAAAADARAVVARNFPAAWVAPSALGSLPQKISSLLQRIGALDGVPAVSQGPAGLEALARFQSADAARDAVQTLHGTDLRTAAEKRAANFQAPKESERFWLRVASDAGAAAASAAGGSAVAAPAATALAPGASPASLKPPAGTPAGDATSRKRIKPNGVYLAPLPPSWAETDVKLLASPYGTVEVVKMEVLSNGQKGAFIDYQKESNASAARGGLDGLSLMGARMRCMMQEEPEPPKPLQHFLIYLDELSMPSRPEAEPRLDDRELFLAEIPRTARTEESAGAWVSSFGDVEEVFLLRDAALKPTGKAYARFRSYAEALKALGAIRAAATDGSPQAAWSEAERALRGARGAYGLEVTRRLAGEGGARLQEIRQATGISSLVLRTADDAPSAVLGNSKATGSTAGQRVHFVLQAERASQADECRALLSADLTKIHEAYAREVRGSLVLRGFPASWSEKGFKFVFAPFGGLSSVALEEEKPSASAGEASSAVRLAYVKLRNESAIEKAVSNLHQTKVGDGDLVEECVVACHRWYLRAWADGSFHVPVFIDQLAMNRRPLEAGPGPEDRELFVQNLPLQDMNRQQLQEYFEGFGEVEDLHLITNIFTSEPTGEGYVRFKQHRDAQRCIEALTPNSPHEAEPMDLAGSWSESERALQRKSNSYRFNLVAELVGADGSGLERLKTDAKLKGLWVLAESLQQKDRCAPPPTGRQLHFVGRVQEESHMRLFHEQLERALEETHTKITDRIEKRRRKAQAAAAAAAVAPGTAASTPAPGSASAPEAPWHGTGSQAAWQTPPQHWGNWQPSPSTGPGPFEGFPHYPGPGQMPPGYAGPPNSPGPPGPWGVPPMVAAPPAGKATVFEQMQPSLRRTEDGPASQMRDDERRSHSRRRRRRGSGGDGGDKEKKHRSGSQKRRRRRERSGSGGGGDREAPPGCV